VKGALIMIGFLQWSAWPMTTPVVYSAFHLLFFFVGTAIMILLAWLLRSLRSVRMSNIIFTVTGLILGLGELYKQLFYYYIINDQHYDWWLFPFQLCSLPIYLCLLLPLIRNTRIRRILCTFLLDFNMMGGIATFIDPSGILHGYWILTLHGLTWHLILIFLGIYIFFTDQADLSWHGFCATLPIFAAVCLIAELLNSLLHSFGSINMFYISPYEMSTQLLFSDIDRLLGRPAGIALYILAMIGGALLIHTICRICHQFAGPTLPFRKPCSK
jgi:hypothetical protein